jgi:hypothetical protein
MPAESTTDRWYILMSVPPRKNQSSPQYAVGPFSSAAEAHLHAQGWLETEIVKNPEFPIGFTALFPQPRSW